MDNEFYNRGATFNPDELADGDAIEAEFDAVARGFDTIGTNVDANKAGYPTQTFHVAPATEATHAARKEQLDTHINDQSAVHGATSVNTPDKLVKRDANGDIGARRFIGDLDGVLVTPRMINGVPFNGGADITIADGTKLPLAGGTLTGALNVNDAVRPLSLEVGAVGSSNTPFIDFHSGAVTTDYDARIIVTGGNGLNAGGAILHQAAAHYFEGQLSCNDSITCNSQDPHKMLSVKPLTRWMQVTTGAQNVFTAADNVLVSGVYLVYMHVNNHMAGGDQHNETYVGTMYWFAEGTNSTLSDEIPLHRMGHSPNTGRTHLRTCRAHNVSPNGQALQIWAEQNDGAACNYDFLFKRIM